MAVSRRRFTDEEVDPSSLLSNMFDIAMVFALALMVALVTKFNMTEIFSQQDYTMVKNPGKDNMEIIMKKGEDRTLHPEQGCLQQPAEGAQGRGGLPARERGDHLHTRVGRVQNFCVVLKAIVPL